MDNKKLINFEAEKLVSSRQRNLILKDIKKSISLLTSRKEDSLERYTEVFPGESLTRTFGPNCLQIDRRGEVFLILSSGWKVRVNKSDSFLIDIISSFSHKGILTISGDSRSSTFHSFLLGSHFLSITSISADSLIVSLSCLLGVRYFSILNFLFLRDGPVRFIINSPHSIIEEKASGGEEDWKYLVAAPIILELGKDLLSLLSRKRKEEFLDRISSIRKHLLLDTGIVIPTVRIKDNLGLRAREFMLSIKDRPAASGEVYINRLLSIGPEDSLEKLKGRRVLDPTFNMSGVWITSAQRDRAEKSGCMIFDPVSVIATLMTEVLRRYSHEFLGIQETEDLLNRSLKDHPVVLRELRKVFSLMDVNKILKNLLAEDISIRDLLTICETAIEYARVSREPDVLSEYVRYALRESICQEYATYDGRLYVSLIDPELESQLILKLIKKNDKTILTLNENEDEKLFEVIKKRYEACQNKGLKTIILCSSGLRLYLRRYIESDFPSVIVLSFKEIASGIKVKPINIITVREEFKIEEYKDREYYGDLEA